MKYSLKKALMLGTVEEKKRRGWPAGMWADSVAVMMSTSLEDLKDQVRDRLSWRKPMVKILWTVGLQYCTRSLSLFFTSNFPHFCLSTGKCQTPFLPPNSSPRGGGDLANTYPVGTVLRLQCNPGYMPIPGTIRSMTCLDTNKWSELPTLCQSEYFLSTKVAVME